MPICKKCNEKFSQYMCVDGKMKNLQRRKYCFKCSPFGQHNTSQIHKESYQGQIMVCGDCHKQYRYDKKHRLGHTLERCNSCMTSIRRFNMKNRCIEYKGGKCEICGYSKYIEVLEFHHKDSDNKDFTLSSAYYYKWTRIKEELDKCICLCANCHRELHAEEDKKKKSMAHDLMVKYHPDKVGI